MVHACTGYAVMNGKSMFCSLAAAFRPQLEEGEQVKEHRNLLKVEKQKDFRNNVGKDIAKKKEIVEIMPADQSSRRGISGTLGLIRPK